MRFSKSIAILFGAGLMLFATANVSATEYLFRLREDAVVLCDDSAELMTEECFDDDSSLARIAGVYTTDDISIIEKYQSLGILEYYEENAPAYLFDMPNTSEYMRSLSSGVPLGESFNQLNINKLWELGLNGKGLKIGVIDSGAFLNNDIAANVLPGYNTYALNSGDTSSLYVYSDGYGHGTMVSGLIAANGTNYSGVAWESKIVPIKAFSDSGSGTVKNMVDGIYIAIDEYGCDILNMSCGTLSDMKTLKGAVEYAILKNVPIIAASGNVNNSNYGTATVGTEDSLMYPACYDGVISVGNIDRNNVLSDKSIENDFVDVVAPGKSITGLNKASSGYITNSGTSFACPIVCGIVACMLQADPTLTVSEIESILQQTATDLGTEGWDMSYGYGKVNCAAIVPKLLDGKLYCSAPVEYKGTCNIALRNGNTSSKNISVFTTESDTAQQVSQQYTLVYGETMNIEAPPSGLLKLLYPVGSNYNLFIRNGFPYTYTSKLILANYSGNKMTGISGQNIKMGKGGYGSYYVPMFASGTTKVFELDTGTFSAAMLLELGR